MNAFQPPNAGASLSATYTPGDVGCSVVGHQNAGLKQPPGAVIGDHVR
jgi:hypothetical protein